MTFVSGIPLYNVWFGHRLKDTSPGTTHLCRIRALESIASAMVQLDKISFQTCGRLLFGSDGNPSGIENMRQVDHKAMLDRWFIHEDPEDDPIYIEYAASNNPKAYYTHMLDVHYEQNSVPKGLAVLLRQLISWISEPSQIDLFVLAHPEFDIQNFIVSEDGKLQGIIDWDEVATVPRSLGNERYPGWLTQDWDPAMYGYKESMEHGVEPEVNHPECRNAILDKIVHEIWTVAGGGEQPDFTELAVMLVDGNMDAVVMETLRRDFHTLLSKKGL